ncbi:MAG: peptide ABC transporter substrate-binding protein [Clostridia bacterium]|nr:peptide ABC transporter substrate-binding protein [Clostridia bacterium]
MKWKWMILVLLLVLVGCSKENTEAKLNLPAQEFIFMIPDEAASLDPNFSNETYGSIVIQHMYEGLVRMDNNGQLIPAACESYEMSNGNTVFTFHLKKDLKWSDGTPITAQDYKNSWMRFLDPSIESVNASMISPYILNLEAFLNGEADESEIGIRVLDDYTLELETYVPTPYLIDILTHNIFFPVRLDQVEKDPENWSKNPELVISNGPFILNAYSPGESFELIKNENYWDKDSIKLDKITFVIRQQDDNIVDMYNNGEINGIFEVTANELRRIYDSELQVNSRVLPSTAFMTFNHDNPLMSDVRFREAIYIALDRQGVVEDVLSGAGIPTRYLVPIIYKINGESFRDYTELDSGKEIEKARALIQALKDEGIYDGRAITFYYMDNGPDALVSEYLMQHLGEDLGLAIDVIGMPWSDLYNLALNDDYDMLMMGWGADYPHPMTFLSAFSKDAFYAPITRWYSTDFEDKIQEFLNLTDQNQALGVLRDLEEMIIGEYHIAPIYYRKSLSLVNQQVKGWYQSTFFNFTRAYITN